jgi:sugar O-acyltransferase (sialic acid O-acetyltransferase NeuD family)
LSTDESEILDLASTCEGFLVCVGNAYGFERTRYSELLLNHGLRAVSAISPQAFIGNTVIVGQGLQAMPHAVVNQFATIGDWCILNTNCSVDHECELGRGVHVMGSAALAGRVKVGDFSTIGTNATILPDLTIGRRCFVGAGSVVTKNVPDDCVVGGVPAKSMRNSLKEARAFSETRSNPHRRISVNEKT